MATVVTNSGRELITDITDGTTASPGTFYISSGTGAGTAAITDTTLFTEVSESRVAATKSQPITTTNRFAATQTYTGSKTITNAAVFSAASAGTMIVKGDFTGIAVASGDSIEFTIDLQN